MPFTSVQLARLRLAACVRSRTTAAQTWFCIRRCPKLRIRPRHTNAQTFYCLFQRHRFQTYIRTYLPRHLATPNWLSLSDLHLVQRNLGSRPIMIVCVPNLRNISRISIFP